MKENSGENSRRILEVNSIKNKDGDVTINSFENSHDIHNNNDLVFFEKPSPHKYERGIQGYSKHEDVNIIVSFANQQQFKALSKNGKSKEKFLPKIKKINEEEIKVEKEKIQKQIEAKQKKFTPIYYQKQAIQGVLMVPPDFEIVKKSMERKRNQKNNSAMATLYPPQKNVFRNQNVHLMQQRINDSSAKKKQVFKKEFDLSILPNARPLAASGNSYEDSQRQLEPIGIYKQDISNQITIGNQTFTPEQYINRDFQIQAFNLNQNQKISVESKQVDMATSPLVNNKKIPLELDKMKASIMTPLNESNILPTPKYTQNQLTKSVLFDKKRKSQPMLDQPSLNQDIALRDTQYKSFKIEEEQLSTKCNNKVTYSTLGPNKQNLSSVLQEENQESSNEGGSICQTKVNILKPAQFKLMKANLLQQQTPEQSEHLSKDQITPMSEKIVKELQNFEHFQKIYEDNNISTDQNMKLPEDSVRTIIDNNSTIRNLQNYSSGFNEFQNQQNYSSLKTSINESQLENKKKNMIQNINMFSLGTLQMNANIQGFQPTQAQIQKYNNIAEIYRSSKMKQRQMEKSSKQTIKARRFSMNDGIIEVLTSNHDHLKEESNSYASNFNFRAHQKIQAVVPSVRIQNKSRLQSQQNAESEVLSQDTKKNRSRRFQRINFPDTVSEKRQTPFSTITHDTRKGKNNAMQFDDYSLMVKGKDRRKPSLPPFLDAKPSVPNNIALSVQQTSLSSYRNSMKVESSREPIQRESIFNNTVSFTQPKLDIQNSIKPLGLSPRLVSNQNNIRLKKLKPIEQKSEQSIKKPVNLSNHPKKQQFYSNREVMQIKRELIDQMIIQIYEIIDSMQEEAIRLQIKSERNHQLYLQSISQLDPAPEEPRNDKQEPKFFGGINYSIGNQETFTPVIRSNMFPTVSPKFNTNESANRRVDQDSIFQKMTAQMKNEPTEIAYLNSNMTSNRMAPKNIQNLPLEASQNHSPMASKFIQSNITSSALSNNRRKVEIKQDSDDKKQSLNSSLIEDNLKNILLNESIKMQQSPRNIGKPSGTGTYHATERSIQYQSVGKEDVQKALSDIKYQSISGMKMKNDIENFISQAQTYLKDENKKTSTSKVSDYKDYVYSSQDHLQQNNSQIDQQQKVITHNKILITSSNAYNSFAGEKNVEKTLQQQDTGKLTLNIKSCESLTKAHHEAEKKSIAIQKSPIKIHDCKQDEIQVLSTKENEIISSQNESKEKEFKLDLKRASRLYNLPGSQMSPRPLRFSSRVQKSQVKIKVVQEVLDQFTDTQAKNHHTPGVDEITESTSSNMKEENKKFDEKLNLYDRLLTYKANLQTYIQEIKNKETNDKFEINQRLLKQFKSYLKEKKEPGSVNQERKYTFKPQINIDEFRQSPHFANSSPSSTKFFKDHQTFSQMTDTLKQSFFLDHLKRSVDYEDNKPKNEIMEKCIRIIDNNSKRQTDTSHQRKRTQSFSPPHDKCGNSVERNSSIDIKRIELQNSQNNSDNGENTTVVHNGTGVTTPKISRGIVSIGEQNIIQHVDISNNPSPDGRTKISTIMNSEYRLSRDEKMDQVRQKESREMHQCVNSDMDRNVITSMPSSPDLKYIDDQVYRNIKNPININLTKNLAKTKYLKYSKYKRNQTVVQKKQKEMLDQVVLQNFKQLYKKQQKLENDHLGYEIRDSVESLDSDMLINGNYEDYVNIGIDMADEKKANQSKQAKLLSEMQQVLGI